MVVDEKQSGQDEPISVVVLNRIAEREGLPVEDLRPPLYEAIDPDSLESLFRDGSGKVVFEYLGFEITVTHDGTVGVVDSSQTE